MVTTLLNERVFGGSKPTGLQQLLDLCTTLDIENAPVIDDLHVRSQLAKFAVKASGLHYSSFRSLSALSRGEEPGPENSIGKLVAGQLMQDIARFALSLEGEAGLLEDPACSGRPSAPIRNCVPLSPTRTPLPILGKTSQVVWRDQGRTSRRTSMNAFRAEGTWRRPG